MAPFAELFATIHEFFPNAEFLDVVFGIIIIALVCLLCLLTIFAIILMCFSFTCGLCMTVCGAFVGPVDDMDESDDNHVASQ